MKKSTIMKQKRLKKKYDILSKGEVTELLDYNYRLIIMKHFNFNCKNIKCQYDIKQKNIYVFFQVKLIQNIKIVMHYINYC